MKKSFLLLILLSAVCVSTNAFSACVKKPGFKCPNIKCPSGTILGDDGVCYACDTPETIDVSCTNEILYPSCSNRIAIKVPCRTISIFCSSTICSDGFFMGDDGKCHSCDDEADVEDFSTYVHRHLGSFDELFAQQTAWHIEGETPKAAEIISQEIRNSCVLKTMQEQWKDFRNND